MPQIPVMMDVCDDLTLGSARHLSVGQELLGRHQKIRPLLHSLWVYMFYVFPSSLFRFFSMSFGKLDTAWSLGPPASSTHSHLMVMKDFSWDEKHAGGECSQCAFRMGLWGKGWDPISHKSSWKFPALRPSVSHGTICSQWATPQESVFIKTSRLNFGRICK